MKMLALYLVFAATVLIGQAPNPPIPNRPENGIDKGIQPELNAPRIKKNVYPCAVRTRALHGLQSTMVHEKGGRSTFYPPIYGAVAYPADLGLSKLKTIPDCVDPLERDGR